MTFKKIKFISKDDTLEGVKPAKSFIPKWYKDVESHNIKNLKFTNNDPVKNVKSCVPFLDSITSGYMIELWCDVHFESLPDGSHYIRWGDANPAPIGIRNTELNKIPTPIGCSKYHYVWQNPYSIETPNGYSILVTHPNNRIDLPFFTLSGIIDSDSVMPPGVIPFFIKEGFSGVLEAGTPIAQVIPFKRENWKIEKDNSLIEKSDKVIKNSNRKFFGYYKNNQWKKKTYE
jgi:hypothetical protein